MKDALGVFFRGRGGHRLHVAAQPAHPDKPLLRPHVRQPGGGYVLLGEIPLPAGTDLKQQHHLRITTAGQTITTWLDDVQVDTRERSDHNAPGVVGFRTNGEEDGVVHSLKVTSAGGEVLVDTEFPTGDQTFPDGTVRPQGGLQVKGNTDLWLPGKPIPVFQKQISLPKAKKIQSAPGFTRPRKASTSSASTAARSATRSWPRAGPTTRAGSSPRATTSPSCCKSGANTFGAELAPGWYAGNLAMFGANKYGSDTALIAQLRVTYTDGIDRSLRDRLQLADRARRRTGCRSAQRRESATRGVRRTSGRRVQVRPSATSKLVPQTDQPVRVTQAAEGEGDPVADGRGRTCTTSGRTWSASSRLTLRGSPGRRVKIRYGEVLNPDGTLYTDNLRSAKATDHYTFATSRPETYQPRFTFHGFRYVEVSGLATAPPAERDRSGVVMGTDGEQTNEFRTNSALVNQLHSNIVWGQRGNFLSIPTDTPARDERMGWTGDINVFARTAVYNLDSQAFLTKWLQDLRDTQRADGAYAERRADRAERVRRRHGQRRLGRRRGQRAVDALAGVRRHVGDPASTTTRWRGTSTTWSRVRRADPAAAGTTATG